MSSSKTEKVVIVPTNVRIHDLAKQWGIPNKDVLEKAQALFGKEKAKSHSSVLNPGQADRLKAKFVKVKPLDHSENRVPHGAAEHNAPKIADEAEVPPSSAVAAEEPDASAASSGDETPAEGTAAPAIPTELEAVPAAADQVVEPEVAEEEDDIDSFERGDNASKSKRHPVAGAHDKRDHKPSKFGVVKVAPVDADGYREGTRRSGVKSATSKSAPAAHSKTGAVVSEGAQAKTGAAPSSLLHPMTGAPKRTLTGPVVAPPIQRDAKDDTRFGVVTSAAESERIHGPVPKTSGKRGGRDAQVDSKPVDDFKPQVSYPSLPSGGGASDEEERNARAGMSGGRRSPIRAAPGLKGFGSGPRRGTALMRGDDDRYRGARKQKRGPAVVRPTVTRAGPADVTSPVSIKSLCEALGIKSNTLIKKFFDQNKIVNINTILSDSDAELYALEFDPLKFGVSIKKARDVEEEMLKKADVADKFEDLKPRAPVVTIMGHVDHGKTSLLDFIRQAKVAAGEAGGITQHIGAYKVQHKKGEVAFIDTPGHKAFTEMRARGANVTDVVVLVVAANDGVMPQTEEAISHAKTAGKKIVVALNKIDTPEANPDKVKGQLASKELFVEGYGGEVGCVEVSAKTGQGIDELLDRILLEAEVLELKANPNKFAVGHVVEAHKDQGRGIVCTLLVQEGTLKPGDVIICGHAYGTVRQILADTGKVLKSAGPATPVLVTGLSDVPLSGERFHVLQSIKEAAEIASQRAMRMRQEGLVKRTHVTLETLSDMLAQGAVASLKLVLKVDVQGSLAPLRDEISRLSTADARVDILHDGVGAINETDVLLADASDAIVIGFNVNADPGARRMGEERGVDIRSYAIIYEVVDEMRRALEGILKPIEKELIQGHIAVRQCFKISKVGTIAGCFVTDGLITRASNVRLIRDGKTVWTGKLDSLKRVKDDAKEVRSGFECGVKLEKFDDIKQGDLMEAFTTEQVKRTLEAK